MVQRSCEEHTGWYEDVKKETDGSVEETSFKHMETINRDGCYRIGSSTKSICTSQSQIIQLTLKEGVKHSLDDLSDLESRLVLITGQHSTDMNLFLQVTIIIYSLKNVIKRSLFLQTLAYARRIADILMALQQHGNSEFIGWELQFSCAIPDIVKELKDIGSKMEKDLKDWKQEIQKQRDHFYELNYFTTQQLLILREELGRLKNGSLVQIKPEAITLLQSISREVSQQVVRKQVATVKKMSEEQWRAEIEPAYDQVMQQQTKEQGVEGTSSFLKSILKTDTKKCAAPPSQLKEAELSVNQKAILANLMEHYEYSKRLIMLAFTHCAKPQDEDEVANWCFDHMDMFQSDEPESEEEGEEEGDVMLESDILRGKIETDERHEPSLSLTTRLLVRENVPVDIHHPVVQELMYLGFSPEQSLQAAKRYPDNADAAYTFLEQSGKQGELFKESLQDDVLMHEAEKDTYSHSSSAGISLEEFDRKLLQRSAGRYDTVFLHAVV